MIEEYNLGDVNFTQYFLRHSPHSENLQNEAGDLSQDKK